MKNKLITIITSLVMAATLVMPTAAYAEDNSEKPDGVMGSAIAEEFAVEHAGEMQLMVASGQLSSYANSKYSAKARGLDVSQWQGTIDWKKMKANGVQFAIIRAGVTKSDGTIYKDHQCDNNVKGCEANGIPYGFYYYSCATTTAKVDKEISSLKSYIKGTHPAYPVYYDLEDKKVKAKKSTFVNNMAVKFCDSISKAGYKAGVYSSLSWWQGSGALLTSTKLDKYEKWIAQWPTSFSSSSKCTYKKSYGMWQFTDAGKVGTVKPLDLDFAYKNYSNDTPGYWDNELGVFMEEVDPNSAVLGENDEVIEGDNGEVKYIVAKSKWIVSGGKTYYVDEEGHKMGGGIHEINSKLYFFTSTGYIYQSKWITSGGYKYYALASGKLCRNGTAKISSYYYGFNENGQMLIGSKAIGAKGYYFLSDGKSVLKTCKVKKKVRTRKGPGTKYKKKGTLKKNKVVYVIRTSGKWSQLSTGYWVQTKYLKLKKAYPYAVKVVTPTIEAPTTEATEETTVPEETTIESTTKPQTPVGGEGGAPDESGNTNSGDNPAPEEPLN